MTYEITIDGTPKTLNSFLGYKWAHYTYAKEIKKQVKIALFQKPLPKMSCVRISFTLGFNNKRRSDICDRNTKPHVDALVEYGVLEDDNKEIVREVRTTWEKSDKPFTKIIITEL